MKPIHSTYLVPGLYPKSPILIQDIEFTPRQWDILSAFHHLNKPLLVGSLLGIGNKGVEAHIYNIKQKLPFQRKDLTQFLDTCHAHIRDSLQRHYYIKSVKLQDKKLYVRGVRDVNMPQATIEEATDGKVHSQAHKRRT